MFISNTKILYAKHPNGMPELDTFKAVKEEIDFDEVFIRNEKALVRTLYISVDPYMRALMLPHTGGVIAEIIKSNALGFNKGDVIIAFGELAQYRIVSTIGAQIIPNACSSLVPLSYYLSITGMPGATAYLGLHGICEPIKEGETIFVSAASGAVDQIVGQYGKLLGLNVVGSAGSDDKIEYLLKELNFGGAFNYKKVDNIVDELKKHCPNGIDIYFENVGGKTLDAILEVANDKAKVSVCGMMSQFNKLQTPDPINNTFQILKKQIKMQGYPAADYKELWPKAFQTFSKYLTEGKMKYKEYITEGIENIPETFIDMLKGKNFEKALVKVTEL